MVVVSQKGNLMKFLCLLIVLLISVVSNPCFAQNLWIPYNQQPIVVVPNSPVVSVVPVVQVVPVTYYYYQYSYVNIPQTFSYPILYSPPQCRCRYCCCLFRPCQCNKLYRVGY